jgi:hypothetical protein
MDLTTDILLTGLLFVFFILFALAMLVLCLRFGPRRGYWNQPAAGLVRPGRRMFRSLYAVAILHVLVGAGLALFAPGGGPVIFLVLLGTGAFYAVAAHSWTVGTRTMHRIPRNVGIPPISRTD